MDLDALTAEANYTPFGFRLGGQEWELPNAKSMTSDQLDRYDDGERRKVITEMAGAEMAERLWALPYPILAKLLNGWILYGGIDLGEGAASVTSSESTGAQSEPISAATTA